MAGACCELSTRDGRWHAIPSASAHVTATVRRKGVPMHTRGASEIPGPDGSLVLACSGARGRFWRVIALEPAAQAVEPWKKGAFVDVGLIELVAHFPLQLSRDDHAAVQVRMVLEPRIEPRRRIGHEGKQRELVEDPRIERGRLDEEHERI